MKSITYLIICIVILLTILIVGRKNYHVIEPTTDIVIEEVKGDQNFNTEVVNISKVFNIADNMVITDTNEFNKLYDHYCYLITKKLTANQLKGLKEILIAKSTSFSQNGRFNGASGCFTTIGNYSYIVVAGYSEENDRVLLHELCHSMFYNHIEEFSNIEDEWLDGEYYVSEYATDKLEEDFAETGSYYLIGKVDPNNVKFKLFENFFNNIK